MDLQYFKGRRILITGHTGFKGSWLTEMLLDAGAAVSGAALPPPTDPSLFETLGLPERLGAHHHVTDVRNLSALEEVFKTETPELVIHLAAQPIVRASYEEPVYTYETNVMGTVNVLECIRKAGTVKSALIITTDKVYENLENDRAYEEGDRLDGYDPYSNSKSCAELAVHCYKRSFLDGMGIPVSTARAGNVIGGGDFARDRILPDCVRSAEKGEPVLVRNPFSTRPYQHVLEPLSVYLTILKKQEEDSAFAGYYNVGPDDGDCLTTGHMADLFCSFWGEGQTWVDGSGGNGPHEANFLKLSSRKIRETFGWRPTWNVEEAVRRTVEWARAEDRPACTREEIRAFLEKCVL